MLLVIEPEDRHQQWLGVADLMRAEAQEAANAVLDRFSARANGAAGITPERVIRDGDRSEEILKLIDEDLDIEILVLAAGTGKEGPGPLVSGLGKTVSAGLILCELMVCRRVARALVISERAVEKHVANIFSKLGLAPSDADHRRVLAVLRYLEP